MYEEKNLTILEYIILGKFDNYHNIQINYCKSQSLRRPCREVQNSKRKYHSINLVYRKILQCIKSVGDKKAA